MDRGKFSVCLGDQVPILGVDVGDLSNFFDHLHDQPITQSQTSEDPTYLTDPHRHLHELDHPTMSPNLDHLTPIDPDRRNHRSPNTNLIT